MDNLLPVGSVVTLKGSKKKYMVAGYSQENKGKIFEYKGIDYIYGYNLSDIKLFNTDDISEVLFMGYYNMSNLYFLTEYKKYVDIIRNIDVDKFYQQIINGESNEYTEFVDNLVKNINSGNEKE